MIRRLRGVCEFNALLGGLTLALAAPAAAQEQPVLAPAEPWVDQLPLPAPLDADTGKPFQILLSSVQARHGVDGLQTTHVEQAWRIQSAEALAAMGTIALPWQPDLSDLVINRVEIVRDGKPIDVLARGETFTVIRREGGLERAMMDGVLSAVLQPSDLQLGDTLRFAYTLKGERGRIPFKSESFLVVQPKQEARLLRFRQILPGDGSMRWRASPAMGSPKITRTTLGEEVAVEIAALEAPEAPASAPRRFQVPMTLEVSGWRDWAELSALMHPEYERAARLAPDSPLRAEIAVIAARHAEPTARARAALRLVQDRVRYVFRGMGEGGHTPVAADEAWRLKYGDCKAKTVLLLAVLRELGITAEAALVSSQNGDLILGRLPMMSLFDHVIVRAEIDGASHWLDGTRTGDRALETPVLAVFEQALPLRPKGATLLAVAPAPPVEPLSEVALTIDARKGLAGATPFEARLVWRGDGARQIHAQAGADPVESRNAIERALRGYLPGARVSRFEHAFDDERSAFTATLKGNAPAAWRASGADGRRRYRFSNDVIAWNFALDAETAARRLPVALGYPVHLAATETILLPRDRGGFTLDARPVDETVGGTRIVRTVELAGDAATARSSFRRLAPEISHDEALAAKKAVARINAAEAWLLAPAGYRLSGRETRALAGAALPATADGLLEHGAALIDEDRYPEALVALDRAIALAPDLAQAHVYRAFPLIRKGDLPGAKAALDKAVELGGDADFAQRAFGYYHFEKGAWGQAIGAFSRAIEQDENDVYALARRAAAYARLGAHREAEADLTAALAITPDDAALRSDRADARAALGDEAGALTDSESALAAVPDDADAHWRHAARLDAFGRDSAAIWTKAEALYTARVLAAPGATAPRDARAAFRIERGRLAEALADADWLVAREPAEAGHWNTRCWARAVAGVELDRALADCNKAIALAPEDAASWDSRGFVKLRQGRLAEAIADLDKAIALAPDLAAPRFARGLARLKQGDRAAGERDLGQARRLAPDIDESYRRYGVMP